METEQLFGKRLRILRADKGISQQRVANEIGVTKVGYQNYEYGRKMPSFGRVPKLAAYFNVSTDYLFGLTDEPHPYPPSKHMQEAEEKEEEPKKE